MTKALSTKRASALVAARSGAVIAVAPLEEDNSVTSALTVATDTLRAGGADMVCGLSVPLDGLAAVPAGFDQAVLAASQTSAERPVVSLSELSVVENLVLGATTTTRAMLIDQAEAMLPDARKSLGPLKATLQAFAETNMNVTRAAKVLHIHPNTLRYRLRRVLEQTGRDPHTFGDLLDLLCLVTLLSQPDL
jgi:DNA-binding PucR family transcriptional regulator